MAVFHHSNGPSMGSWLGIWPLNGSFAFLVCPIHRGKAKGSKRKKLDNGGWNGAGGAGGALPNQHPFRISGAPAPRPFSIFHKPSKRVLLDAVPRLHQRCLRSSMMSLTLVMGWETNAFVISGVRLEFREQQ